MTTNKSKNFNTLVKHAIVYASVWIIPIAVLFTYSNPNMPYIWYSLNTINFVIITLVTHTITDYITLRITSKMFADKIYYTQLPNLVAFTVIGFDQVLHYAQIFLTFHALLIYF